MSVELSLDLSGIDELIREMPGLADKVVRQVALDVEATAKRNAPVDTGFLRSSIRMSDPVRGDAEVDVLVEAEYGLYVHEGARGRKPVPFLERALEEAGGRFETRLAALAKEMEEK